MTIAPQSGGHDHSAPSGNYPRPMDAERRTLVAFAVTATFMLVEAGGGLLSGSLALVADAAHMLTDALALLMAWGAFRFGRMAADQRRTYGYRRLEVLAALANGVTVVALSVGVVYAAVMRLAEPQGIAGWPMLVVAAIGLAANAVTLRVLGHGHDHDPAHPRAHPSHHADPHDHRHAAGNEIDHAQAETRNLNLHGAALHVLGDLLGSAAAVGAAVVILVTGWTPIDSILSVAMALLIAVNGVKLVASAAHILLEGTPAGFVAEDVRVQLLRQVPGLVDVHHLHAWSVTSGHHMVTLHAVVTADVDRDQVLSGVKHELSVHFGFAHSVIQIEGEGCRDANCL